MKKRYALFLWVGLSGAVYAQQTASVSTSPATTTQQKELPSPKKITSVEGITEYQLDNGLRVLLFPDESKQTITVNVTYLVGSKHENYGETGMAHLLEHLVFKGTPKHPNIPQELTERGARPNGTTWTDRTNYFETFNATEDNLRWALDLESDRMVNSFIAKEDLESEMTVVRNEFESGENSPFRVLMQRTMSAAYDWHNYGKSTIGARADIENVDIDRLQAFYKKYYQPDNAVLVVAGKFDEEKTLAMVNEFFGPIPRPERELPKMYTFDPVKDGERTVTVRRVGDVQLVMAAYHIPPGSHEDYAAVQVLSRVLGANPSGRLYKSLVDTKKATSASSSSYEWKDPGLLMAFAQVLKEKDLEEAKEAMLATFEDLSTNPPTEDEVEKAKNEILKQTELMLNSSERVGLALSEAIGTGDWRLFFLNRDRVEAVTADDVKRVASKYMVPDNRTVGMFIPTEQPLRAEIPAAPNVAELVKDYKGRELVAAGENFDPSPANIESRTVRTTLSNGMELAMLPKKTRGESVEARMVFRFGDLESLQDKATVASFAGGLLNKGTSSHTREEIKSRLDKLKANVYVGGGASSAIVNITTTRPNLPEVMKLVAEMLQDPIFPEDEFEKAKAERISGIESQRSEPQAVAFNRMQRHTSPYEKSDPRYVGTFDESIEDINAVSLDQVKEFYKNFYGGSNGTMAVVGDFDKDEIESLTEELFADWKNPGKYTRMESRMADVKPLRENMETPDKANAFFVSTYQFEMDDSHDDYAALVLGNYMLGGGFLNSRLATRIRQKEGLSYGVGSNFSAGTLDPIANFMAYAIYAPENADKLEAAYFEEIQKVVTEGFSEDEVKAAKSGWLQSRTVSRAQDSYLSSALNNYLYLDRKMEWDAELEEKIEGLTAEDINGAMQRHLNPDAMHVIKAGDFAKAKQTAEN
ncbi:insulinase family protein [Litoribacter alkaliphilus]|uniref:Insulinase family protein n=1 Tax=Litoribacter ruber TaxID=702568 RepID=A0AAP2CH44_9BACT|nr:pitrilysin family protein [Litoribacter alkaliphilus]MBS9523660.1 insulinase family protein [Litoribacter alkaliphilus]